MIIRISTWPEELGVKHIATSWQISDNTDFVNIIDEVIESDVYLNVFRSATIVPVGKEYYARAKRHFDSGTLVDWDGPIKLISNESGENIDLKPDVYIEEPVVRIDIDEINNGFIIKAGSFRCKNDGHESTNWILRDGIGNILFKSLYDKENKKEIFINNNIINNNTNILIAEVSFVSSNKYESQFGNTKLELNKFNFEVVSNTKYIPVNEDYEFNIKLIPNTTYMLTNYIIKDNDDNVIQTGVFTLNQTRIFVDRIKLKPRTTYNIFIYSSKLPNDVNVTTFYTNSNESIYKINKDYKYMEEYVTTIMHGNKLKLSMCEQFIDNGIPISNGTDKYVDIFHYDKRLQTFTKSDLEMNFLHVNTTGIDGINIKVVDNTKILVDARTGLNGCPEFILYDYKYGKEIKRFSRQNEDNQVQYVNNSTLGQNEILYYLCKENNIIKFKSYNILNNELKDLKLRPDIKDIDANLVYIGNDRILSFGSYNLKPIVYLYDISTDSWYEVNIIPEGFRDLKMTSFLRKDGKVISFNTSDGNNDTLIFDPIDNSINVVKNELDDTIDLDSTIRLRDGEFLRYDSRQENPILYVYR